MKGIAATFFIASICSLAHAATPANKPQIVHGDFDGDGRQDEATLFQSKTQIKLEVRMHGAAKPQELVFGIAAGTQNAVCAMPVALEAFPASCADDESGESLPGCEERQGKVDLSINDNECDPINVYWNKDKKQMAWWRN